MAENEDEVSPTHDEPHHDEHHYRELQKKRRRSHPVMTDDDYIIHRLENQMNWFSQKSSFHQKRYKNLKRWEFIIGASVPVLISISASCYLQQLVPIQGFDFSVSDFLQVASAVGGVFLVVITKQLELEDHYKFWKDYRVNAEQLQYQLMLYKTATEPYHKLNAYHMLVSNTESLLNQENMKWQQSGQKKVQPDEEEHEE